jgi:hypothetical protein
MDGQNIVKQSNFKIIIQPHFNMNGVSGENVLI